MSWIKVDSTTPHKPEVLKLARVLEVSRDDAFGKAMRFWIWLDGVTVDGRVDGVTSHDVDAVVGAEGVAVALEAVGWLELDDESQTITVPNFEAHNGETAKARGLKTQRQARWRKKTVDVPASTSVSTREEKSREEKSKENTPLAPQGEKPINPIDTDSKPRDNGRKPRKRFVPPTLEDVRAYCTERGNTITPSAFIDHYETNGWRQGTGAGRPVKDWKACVRTWENRQAEKPNVPDPSATRETCKVCQRRFDLVGGAVYCGDTCSECWRED